MEEEIFDERAVHAGEGGDVPRRVLAHHLNEPQAELLAKYFDDEVQFTKEQIVVQVNALSSPAPGRSAGKIFLLFPLRARRCVDRK